MVIIYADRYLSKKYSPAKQNYFKTTIVTSELLGVSYFGPSESLKKSYQYFILILMIISFTQVIPMLSEWRPHPEYSPVMLFLDMQVRLTSCLSILIIQIIKNKQIKVVFLKCLHYDFLQVDPFVAYSTYPLRNIIFNMTTFIFYFFVSHFLHAAPLFVNFFQTIVVHVYVQFPTLQYTYLVTAIRLYFGSINGKLNKLASLSYRSAEQAIDDISKCRQKHLELIDLTTLVNEAFSYQLVIFIADFFFEMIFFLQTAFTNFIFKPNYSSVNVWIFVGNGSFVLLLLGKIVQLTKCCERNMEQCAQLQMTINRISDSSGSKRFNEELRAYLFQNMQRTVSFTLFGSLTLDFKLLYGMMSSVASYGIIIAVYYLSVIKE